jgi:hypothetical protein
VRQWKIAISLAIIGAAVAPFASGTWKIRPISETWLPLTEDQKKSFAAYVEKRNCKALDERFNEARGRGIEPPFNNDAADTIICDMRLKSLREGGESHSYFSVLKYLAINSGVALGGFFGVFGLAFLLPALIRRYWRWLTT